MYLNELAALCSELQCCVLGKINVLDAEQGIWNPALGLTNGEGFTGLARASISMELHCKNKSFAEKST